MITKIFNLGIYLGCLWGVREFILVPMNFKVGITNEGLITAIICSVIALSAVFMFTNNK